MAINRDRLIMCYTLIKGGWNNFIPWAFRDWWLDPQGPEIGPNGQYFRYDPGKAIELLTAAGHPDGLQVDLISTPAYGDVWMQHIELVLADLKAIGIEATVKLQEYGNYIGTTASGDFPSGNTLAFGIMTPFTEPHDWLFNPFHPHGTRNAVGVNDAKLNVLIDQESKTFDRELRKQQIFEIQRYLGHQMYYVPGVAPYRHVAFTPRVRDLYPRSDFRFGAELAPQVRLAG
jgi:ABC-type transport system substrate-binding protein